MTPAEREVVVDGLRLAIRARLGTVVYYFFDNHRRLDGWVYAVERRQGIEFEVLGEVRAAPAANDDA